jgi:hypothetical protein
MCIVHIGVKASQKGRVGALPGRPLRGPLCRGDQDHHQDQGQQGERRSLSQRNRGITEGKSKGLLCFNCSSTSELQERILKVTKNISLSSIITQLLYRWGKFEQKPFYYHIGQWTYTNYFISTLCILKIILNLISHIMLTIQVL